MIGSPAPSTVTELQALASQAERLRLAAEVERQRLAESMAVVTGYADSNGAGSAPSLLDLGRIGVTGVDAGNLKSVLSALESAAVTGAQVDSLAELQALVDAYTRIRTEANGSQPDANPASNPSVADYRSVGVVLSDAQAAQIGLLNEVIGQQSIAGVDTVPKLQALADAMARVLGTDSQPASLADFATLGIGGVNAANLEAMRFEIAAAAAEQAGPLSRADLQQWVDQTLSLMLDRIRFYADNSRNAEPTVEDYAQANIRGVDSINIFAINSALASQPVSSQQITDTVATQQLVDTFLRILGEANGLDADATPDSDPTSADFARIGASTAAALDAPALRLLNDVIGDLRFYAVDSVAEIESLARQVGKVMAIAQGQTPSEPLRPADLNAMGITGTTTAQIEAMVQRFLQQPVSPNAIDSTAELRSYLRDAARVVGLQRMAAYADGDTSVVLTASDYINAGFTGVTSANVGAINSVLASPAITGALADTPEEVDAIIRAYNQVLGEANGAFADATPGIDPTRQTYATLGATVAAALSDEGIALLNSAIGNTTAAGVNTVAKIEALAAAVDRLLNPSQALSLADLGLLGINTSGLQAADLPLLTQSLGNAVSRSSLSEVQALVNRITEQLPQIYGLRLSTDTGFSGNDFKTQEYLQTITAQLTAVLDPNERLYGRVDGSGASAPPGAGWTDLTGLVDGHVLRWFNVELLTGSGHRIELQVVRQSNGQATLGERLSQSYAVLTDAPATPTEAPQIIGPNPTPVGIFSLVVQRPGFQDARVVLVVDGREVPSLYHEATNTLMPLSNLPIGSWNIQYRFQDAAGNTSASSPSLTVQVVAPQNISSQPDMDGDGVAFQLEKPFQDLNNDGIDDADQRDVVAVTMSDGQGLAVDSSNLSRTGFEALLSDSSLNPGANLKVEIQVDSVTSRQVTDAERLAALAVRNLTGDDLFVATDVVEFRLYPQVVRTGLVDESVVDLLSSEVINSHVGQIHRIDLRVPEGFYNTYYKFSYDPVQQTQVVWAFTWDDASQTGARFIDTNNDGRTDKISLFIRDGGRGDDDGKADGVILDPGFVAYAAPTPEVALDSPLLTGNGLINAAEIGNVTVSGSTTGVEAGQVITLVFSGQNAQGQAAEVRASTTASASGLWSVSGINLSALRDGSVALDVRVSNAANYEASTGTTAVIDTAPPAAGTLSLGNFDDSGASAPARRQLRLPRPRHRQRRQAEHRQHRVRHGRHHRAGGGIGASPDHHRQPPTGHRSGAAAQRRQRRGVDQRSALPRRQRPELHHRDRRVEHARRFPAQQHLRRACADHRPGRQPNRVQRATDHWRGAHPASARARSAAPALAVSARGQRSAAPVAGTRWLRHQWPRGRHGGRGRTRCWPTRRRQPRSPGAPRLGCARRPQRGLEPTWRWSGPARPVGQPLGQRLRQHPLVARSLGQHRHHPEQRLPGDGQ